MTQEKESRKEAPFREIWGGHEASDTCQRSSRKDIIRRLQLMGKRSSIYIDQLNKQHLPIIVFRDGETFSPANFPTGTLLFLTGEEFMKGDNYGIGDIHTTDIKRVGVIHEEKKGSCIDTVNYNRNISPQTIDVISGGRPMQDFDKHSQREIVIEGLRLIGAAGQIDTKIITGYTSIHTKATFEGLPYNHFFKINQVDVVKYGETKTAPDKKQNPLRQFIPRKT